jgi:integrase
MTRGEGRRRQDQGAFGTVSKLPSGRWRALYYGPEGKRGRRYKAPTTFTTKRAARQWLSTVQAEIILGKWLPPLDQQAPASRTLTLGGYAQTWLAQRDLKERTREHYRWLYETHIARPLGRLPIASITADDVRAWYANLDKSTPTLRSHCYGLLRTIMGTALTDGKIPANPCVIRGAGAVKRAHNVRPASLDELAKLVDAMPARYQAMVLLASWCALRFGELAELRRRDIDLEQAEEAVIRVRRGVVRTDDGFKVTSPKSAAGSRDVAIPSRLVPALKDHLVDHVAPGADSLLFPAVGGGHLQPSTLYRHFYKARDAAGRPDLRFHDLRHTGGTLTAAVGGTLAEVMARLGHSTPAAALRYLHVAAGRDREIAAALSKLADTP